MNVSVNKGKLGFFLLNILLQNYLLWKKYFLLCTFFNKKYHTLLQIPQRIFNIKYYYYYLPDLYSTVFIHKINVQNIPFQQTMLQLSTVLYMYPNENT